MSSESKQPFKWIANENTFLTNFDMDDPGTYPIYDTGFDGLPISEFWTVPDFQPDGYDRRFILSRREIAALYWLTRGIISDASVDVGVITTTDEDGTVYTNTDTYSDNLTDPNYGDGLLSLEVNDSGYYPQDRSNYIPGSRQYSSSFTLPFREDDQGNELNPNTFRATIIVNAAGPYALRRLYKSADYSPVDLIGYGINLGSAFVKVDNGSAQDNHSVSKQITISTYFANEQESDSLAYGSKNVTYTNFNVLGVPLIKETIEIDNVGPNGYISSNMINLGSCTPWLWEY